MNHAVRGLTLTLCLASLSAGLTVAESTSTMQVAPAATAATVAHVYVGTTKGIYHYDAATTGKLTLTKATPDATPAGLLIGVTGNYLITLGTHIIHSYLLSSAGVIGGQISQINTESYYDNGDCDGVVQGTIGLASLNHQGKNVYVIFPINDGNCAASIQTFNIKSGKLSFNTGIITGNNSGSGLFQAPTMLANDTYAYAASDFECCGGSPGWSGYSLGSTGEMNNLEYNLDPYTDLPGNFVPIYITAGTSNFLAAIVSLNDGPEQYEAPQLASYTVDVAGNVATTATPANMPPLSMPVSFVGMTLNMSPSGKLLAVAGPAGLQVFHFNGAAPITADSKLLTTDSIASIRWDSSNHLYALSFSTKKLYVFTITTTTISPVTGSPFTIPTGTPNALTVVSK